MKKIQKLAHIKNYFLSFFFLLFTFKVGFIITDDFDLKDELNCCRIATGHRNSTKLWILHSHLIIVYHRYDNRLSCLTMWRNPVFSLLTLSLSTILPATYFICQRSKYAEYQYTARYRRGWSFLWSSIKSISAADSAYNCLQPNCLHYHQFAQISTSCVQIGRRPVLHMFSFASCHFCCVFSTLALVKLRP